MNYINYKNVKYGEFKIKLTSLNKNKNYVKKLKK